MLGHPFFLLGRPQPDPDDVGRRPLDHRDDGPILLLGKRPEVRSVAVADPQLGKARR